MDDDALLQADAVERALVALEAPPAWAECLRVEQARNCYSGRTDNLRGVVAYPAANMSDGPW